jgi:hypothetical protein
LENTKEGGVFDNRFVMLGEHCAGAVIGIKDQVGFPIEYNSVYTSIDEFGAAYPHISQVCIKQQIDIHCLNGNQFAPVAFTGREKYFRTKEE